MAPGLEYAEGAYRSVKGTDEHADLTSRAHEDGEFSILDVSDSDEQLFVPDTMEPSMAVAAYAMEENKPVLVRTNFIPGIPRPEVQSPKKTTIGKFLAKIGLKGVK